MRREPDPARGARPGAVAAAPTPVHGGLDDVGPAGERGVQRRHVVRRGALLRPVHRGRAVRRRAAGCRRRWPPPRVVSASAGCRPDRSTRSRSRERGAAVRPVRAPSASSSRAPSACSMPAPPSVLALPPMPSTICRQPGRARPAITSPVPYGARASGVEPVGQQQREPGHVGHLDDRHVVAAPRTPCPPARRSGPSRGPRPARTGGDGGVQRAVAAVGHRDLHDLDVRRTRRRSPPRPARRPPRGQRSLELVGGHQDDAHRRLSRAGRWRVGASSPRSASSSNSTTLSSSVPIEMLVTRSRITSTTHRHPELGHQLLRLLQRRAVRRARCTRIALQPRPSATLTWSTP